MLTPRWQANLLSKVPFASFVACINLALILASVTTGLATSYPYLFLLAGTCLVGSVLFYVRLLHDQNSWHDLFFVIVWLVIAALHLFRAMILSQ